MVFMVMQNWQEAGAWVRTDGMEGGPGGDRHGARTCPVTLRYYSHYCNCVYYEL